MNGFIYIIKNTVNNKVYIGQTRTSISQRWKEHLRHAEYGDQVINRAMKKHGVENFYIETLEVCTFEELNQKEIYYIGLYDSTDKTKGYNVSIGGSTPAFKKIALNIAELKYLYLEKLFALNKIAEIFNVSRHVVKAELKNAGVPIRKRAESNNKAKRVSIKLIEEALIKTTSLRQAAKYANIKYSTFRNACILNHIEYNSSTSARHSDKE